MISDPSPSNERARSKRHAVGIVLGNNGERVRISSYCDDMYKKGGTSLHQSGLVTIQNLGKR